MVSYLRDMLRDFEEGFSLGGGDYKERAIPSGLWDREGVFVSLLWACSTPPSCSSYFFNTDIVKIKFGGVYQKKKTKTKPA